MAKVNCFFFFSSRRRHTRCYRDWSSDVCSSDLSRDQASGATASHARSARRRRSAGALARNSAIAHAKSAAPVESIRARGLALGISWRRSTRGTTKGDRVTPIAEDLVAVRLNPALDYGPEHVASLREELRRLLVQLGADPHSPLSGIVAPGDTVVLKPNLVFDRVSDHRATLTN